MRNATLNDIFGVLIHAFVSKSVVRGITSNLFDLVDVHGSENEMNVCVGGGGRCA